jgi:hypothetical protein
LLRSARNDEKERNDTKWREALAGFEQVDREVEALVHCRNQRTYDRALGRHSTALKRLMRAPAPDLAAAGLKLELIVRHHVFEASFAQAALATLRRDIARFAALPSSPREANPSSIRACSRRAAKPLGDPGSEMPS